MKRKGPVSGAPFAHGEAGRLTYGSEKMSDVFAALSKPEAVAIQASKICTNKLRGAGVLVDREIVRAGEGRRDGAAGERAVTRGLRWIDDVDVAAAPILRGREGENVCDWVRPWYDDILRSLLGWAFP